MNDASESLDELKKALDALSPHDLAAWTSWVEGRLTERLRQRQEHRRAPFPDDVLPVSGPPTEEEAHDA